MNEALQMLQLATSQDTPNVTSSPGSADGPSPSRSQECQTTTQSGQGAAPVNPSAPHLENEKVLPINVTSGLSGQGSSASVALQFALENKLRQLLGTDGSILYRQTWKIKATPSGRRYLALVASALPKSDNGYIGWPTPNASQHNYYENPDGWLARQEQRKKDGKQTFAINLGIAAKFTSGTALSGSPVETGDKDHVNPELARWLMGFPTGWTNYAPTGTRSALRSPRNSFKRSLKRKKKSNDDTA